MSSIRELYRRFRQLIHEGAKFLIVGGIGTIVTFGVANGLHALGDYIAVTIATILATIVTFLGNRHWSFRHRQGNGTARETAMFFILNGIGLLIYYGCIWAARAIAGPGNKLWYNIALVVGTGLGTLFRFWSYRKWVWGETGVPQAQGGRHAMAPGQVVVVAPVHAVATDADADSPGPEQERLTPVAAPAGRPPSAPPSGRPAGAHRRH